MASPHKRQKTSNPWDAIAARYLEEIISPLSHSLDNPIARFLDRTGPHTRHSIIDIGCGIGQMLPQLAHQFKRVAAVDSSTSMLDRAFTNLWQKDGDRALRVDFYQASMEDLSTIKETFDVVLSINSLLSSDKKQLGLSLSQMADKLAPNGDFLAIIPSLESIRECFEFIYYRERKKYRGHSLALASTHRQMNAQSIDFALGIFDTGDMAQKYYSQYEFEKLWQAAGFCIQQVTRVEYQKEHRFSTKNLGPKAPLMWDWCIHARK